MSVIGKTNEKYLENRNDLFEKEQLVFNEPKDGQINHRTFWINSNLFHKLFSIRLCQFINKI